jgi:hypothetical protein
MKIITLLLMMTSISVAQAQVYRCPGKVEGQYTYQDKQCKGAKVDEHTLKIIPADEQKIAEAQAKLAKDLHGDKSQEVKELNSKTNKETTNNNPASAESAPSATKTTPAQTTVNPNSPVTTTPVAAPKTTTGIRPAPVVPVSPTSKPAPKTPASN